MLCMRHGIAEKERGKENPVAGASPTKKASADENELDHYSYINQL